MSNKGSLSEDHHKIKQALTLFPYFDTWDDNVISECCQISAIVEFSPDEIILGVNKANLHMAFFIMDGISQVVYQLNALKKVDSNGRTTYKLAKHDSETSSNSQRGKTEYASMLFNEEHDFQRNDGRNTRARETNENHQVLIESIVLNSEDDSEIFRNGGINEVIISEEEKNEFDGKSYAELSYANVDAMESLKNESKTNDKIEESIEDQKAIQIDLDNHLKVLKECKTKSKKIIKPKYDETTPQMPKGVKTFFIQVALYYKGACFGLEENVKEKFIVMAATKLKCLRIPKRFLLQHNPCNIWNRIRLFFNLYLPKEKEIFEYFTSNRNWNKIKEKQSKDIISLKNIPNYTLCSEVPFSIRLVEVPQE